MPAVLDNATIAERLEAFAALLDLAGSGHYTSRAYRRAAETVRETRAPVEELVREGRVRELRGIGPGIAARLRELVETGTDRRARRARAARCDRSSSASAGCSGSAPKRMLEVAAAARRRDGRGVPAGRARRRRLRGVTGIGPATEAQAARAAAPRSRGAAAARGCPAQPRAGARRRDRRRARRRARGRPAPLGRRVRPSSPSSSPPSDQGRCSTRSQRLPLIVGRRRARPSGARSASPSRASPSSCVVAEPARFGTELLRATGSRAYVDALGPLPDARRRGRASTRALGVPWCPPELREAPFRGEPPRLVELADIRGDLHCHTTWSDGKASVLEMGLAARELGHEYVAICDHTPNVPVVPGLDADALRRQAEEIAAANDQLAPVPPAARRRGRHPPRRLARPARRRARRARLGAAQPARGPARGRATRADAQGHGGDAPSGGPLPQPPDRPADPPPAAERARPRSGLRGRARDRRRARGERPARPARPRDEHVRLAVEAGVPVVCSTDAHSMRGLGNLRLASHRAPRLGDRGRRAQHAAARRAAAPATLTVPQDGRLRRRTPSIVSLRG